MEEKNDLASLWIERRYIDGRKPDTSFTLFGEKFSTPVIAAIPSLGEKKIAVNEGEKAAKDAYRAGMACFTDVEDEKAFIQMAATGVKIISIIKPYADNQIIIEKIKKAEEQGAFAVGIDIAGAFDHNGECAIISGQHMAPKSMEEIGTLIKNASRPFVVKGILSMQDAYKCLEAGAEGLLISRPRPFLSAPPLPRVLRNIKKVAGGQAPVLLDWGIHSGENIFKALVLGADGVCIRRLMGAMGKDDAMLDAVKQVNDELKGFMAQTGCYDLTHLESSVIQEG